MSKNLIPKIAEMLGLQLGEEFKVKGYDDLTYRFDSAGLKLTHYSGIEIAEISANVAFVDLVNGKDEIVKLPWKPKHKDKYWTFYINDHNKLDTCWNIWTEEIAEFARLKAGWIYRSRAEAQVALPAVAAELGVEYEL